LQTL
jgi:hypothetical protein